MRASLTILLTLWLICGCAVGPDYQRPAYPVPDNFRGQGPGYPQRHRAEASFGDLKWFEVFKDAHTPGVDPDLLSRRTTTCRSRPSGSSRPGSR